MQSAADRADLPVVAGHHTRDLVNKEDPSGRSDPLRPPLRSLVVDARREGRTHRYPGDGQVQDYGIRK